MATIALGTAHLIIIKGVRESTLSVGKSRARNPTQNPTQQPPPNRPEPRRTLQRLRTAPCPQSTRRPYAARVTVLIKVKIKKKKPTQLSTTLTVAVVAPQRGSSTHHTPHHTPLHHSKVHPPHAAFQNILSESPCDGLTSWFE